MIFLGIFFKFQMLSFISLGWTYPEMVTHGYGNCIACHVSTTGGGLLTQYGRALSKELLSAKSSDLGLEKIKNEESFLQGWFVPPEKLNVGGDIRFLQMFLDNKHETSGRGILMQADLEAQLTLNPRIRILGTAGRQERRTTPDKLMDNFISRRHWLNVLLGPDINKEKYQIRLGRFFPAYGQNIQEHKTVTRSGLGFDENQESYNAEFSYFGENWSVLATLIGGRPDKLELNREKGAAIQSSVGINSISKMGINLYSGKSSNQSSADRKTMGGVFGVLSMAPKLYTLFEFDRTFTPRKSYGVYQYGKIGYEYIQGLHFFVSLEYEKPSILKFDKKIEAINLGVQYFPKVHWEINSVLRQEKNTFVSMDQNSILTILMHYYL
jgi:hypothetical protein